MVDLRLGHREPALTGRNTMTAYFDTSATVKLYLVEPDSIMVEQVYGASRQVFSHEIAYVEVRAALAIARRMQRLDEMQHHELVADFMSDWRKDFSQVSTDEALLERAAELAEGFGLRGYDAMHLASADRLRSQLPALVFVSFDRALNRAAKLIGLSLPDFTPIA